MTRKLFFTSILITFSIICNAQFKDLANLSKGELKAFDILYKDNQVFGYFLLYDLGETSKTSKKFEYIVLDKNLNSTLNKEFETENFISTYSCYMNYKDEIVLNPYVNDDFSYRKSIIPKSKRISVKTNEIYDKQKQCYNDNVFSDCPDNETVKEKEKKTKEERKQKGFVYESFVSELKYGGYFVSDYEDYEDYIKNNNLIRFDDNKKELWRLSYNKNGSTKNYEYYKVLNLDSNYIYVMYVKVEKKEEKNYIIQIMDINSGKIVKEKTINEFDNKTLKFLNKISFQYNLNNDQDFDDKFVITSAIRSKLFKNLGYYRILIDKKTLEITINSNTWENEVSKFIDVDKYGGVEKGYSLELRDVLFLKDGSITYVTEKFKFGANIATLLTNQLVAKNTDLVLIQTDKDFKIKGIKTLEKEKSTYSISDYLFHQYLNNKNDMVFYYKDYQKDENKDKNWNLFINTIIDGKFNQEKIQISSKKDKYAIIPYPAKDGYILLNEYNKKDKYNQIRLEKLNY